MHFFLFHLPTFFPRFHLTAGESSREAAYSEQSAAYKELREGFKTMDYDNLYPHHVIFGDPDQCAERIQQIHTTGVTNVGLLANFGGREHAKVVASPDRFARYVRPRFR